MITYHPFGSRGYKNLQIWDHNAPDKELKTVVNHNACVLMNDQEPIHLDSIYHWKKEQHTLLDKHPFNHLYEVYALHNPHREQIFRKNDLIKWQKEKHVCEDLVQYCNEKFTDLEWIARLMFMGVRKPIIVHSELRSPEVQ